MQEPDLAIRVRERNSERGECAAMEAHARALGCGPGLDLTGTDGDPSFWGHQAGVERYADYSRQGHTAKYPVARADADEDQDGGGSRRTRSRRRRRRTRNVRRRRRQRRTRHRRRRRSTRSRRRRR